MAELSPAVIELCRMTDAADVALPVAGGMLDQADTFVECMRLLRICEAKITAERTKPPRATA